MSFSEILEELKTLTPEQREIVVQRALEIDELNLTLDQEKMLEERLAEHDKDPSSAIPADVVVERLRSRLKT